MKSKWAVEPRNHKVIGMIIYCAKNTINNKMYVGKTTHSLTKRMEEHKQDAKRRKKTHFYSALLKYGFDSFVWSEVCKCSSLEELNAKEIEYIALWDTINSGYNLTSGGTGGDTFTHDPNKEIRRLKIGAASKGKAPCIYPSTRVLWSMQRKGKKHKPCSDETKNKIGIKNSGSNNWCSVLTEEIVRDIKTQLKNGGIAYRIHKNLLKNNIKIAASVIYNIKGGHSWKHVKI